MIAGLVEHSAPRFINPKVYRLQEQEHPLAKLYLHRIGSHVSGYARKGTSESSPTCSANYNKRCKCDKASQASSKDTQHSI